MTAKEFESYFRQILRDPPEHLKQCIVCGDTATHISAFIAKESISTGAEPEIEDFKLYGLCEPCKAAGFSNERAEEIIHFAK